MVDLEKESQIKKVTHKLKPSCVISLETLYITDQFYLADHKTKSCFEIY